MNELNKILGELFNSSKTEVATPVRASAVESNREAIETVMTVVFQNYENLIKELERVCNARGDRINELLEEVTKLEAEIYALNEKKPKSENTYKKGKEALKRLKK